MNEGLERPRSTSLALRAIHLSRKGIAVGERVLWTLEQAMVQGDRKGSRRTADAFSGCKVPDGAPNKVLDFDRNICCSFLP